MSNRAIDERRAAVRRAGSVNESDRLISTVKRRYVHHSRFPAKQKVEGEVPRKISAKTALRLSAVFLGCAGTSLDFESVAPSHDFEFGTDGVRDRNYGTHLEGEGRQHRTKFMERQCVVAIHQQVSSPIANAYHEKLDLKIGGRLLLPKNLEDSRLSLLVFPGPTLWAFVPAGHVLHRILPGSG